MALGLLLRGPLTDGGDTSAPASIELAGTGVHEVQLAFDSPTDLQEVAFVVELPPGVELVGYPDQRRIEWQGRLAAGRSRLRLPLRVTSEQARGTLVARIARGETQQTLRVPLRVRGSNGEASASSVRRI